ncbi:hypothetical protein EDB19DRAFT_1917691 [Suillus lakei]|nr:hypothetical protein EDB19DRAFT_1917691 [Suillus lakei]
MCNQVLLPWPSVLAGVHWLFLDLCVRYSVEIWFGGALLRAELVCLQPSHSCHPILQGNFLGSFWLFLALHPWQYLFGTLWIYNWKFGPPLPFSHISIFSLSSPMNPSTPPTSPQWAQAAAHQAERNQRNLGSPPARCHPNAPAVQPLLQNTPQMNIPQMLGNLNHGPIPMQRFPGLPCNVIEHHKAQHMWRQHHPQPAPPPVPAPALVPPFGHIPAPAPAALQNEYEHHMTNVAAATMNNLEAHHAVRWRRNNPQPPPPPPPPAPAPTPAPAAPPMYGPIHYEGTVGPHNLDNPLQYFAPNPAPPLPALPGPNHHQFNIQFQHHFQEQQREDERVRNDLLQRQAWEAFHQQQIQQQLQ